MLQLDIWDTAGLEGFRTVTRSYYYGAKAVVIVYDLTVSKSFYDLQLWYQDITTFAPHAALFLIGNKSDLGTDDVDRKVVQGFVDSYDVKMHFRVSVKNNDGIQEAFTAIARYLHTDTNVAGSAVYYGNTSVVLGNQPETPLSQETGACSC